MAHTAAAVDQLGEDEVGEEDLRRMPIGIGFTGGPSSVLLGATFDLPLDDKLTVGPSLQYGYHRDRQIVAPTVQAKYFLRGVGVGEEDRTKLVPYGTAGLGFAYIDESGRSADAGLLVNFGAGLRYLTGQDYRIGSEARLNFLPGQVSGERFYFSWELIQLVFEF